MKPPILYRKRLIPNECILLDKDTVLECCEDHLITSWKTIRPKKDLSHGVSAYFWNQGIKVSKFYDHQNQLICWYCDIISHDYCAENNVCIVTDLLVDVLVYPNGTVNVVDLDELSDAVEQQLISKDLLLKSLRNLDALLQSIYNGNFKTYQNYIEKAEAW